MSCKGFWFDPSYKPAAKMKNSSWHRIFSAFAKICKVFFPSSSTQPCSSFPKSQQATLSLAKKETSSMNQVLEASRMVVHPTTVLWNRSGISVRLQRLQLSQWHLLRGSLLQGAKSPAQIRTQEDVTEARVSVGVKEPHRVPHFILVCEHEVHQSA